MSNVIQVRNRGTMTLPKKIRDKYRIEDGDPLTLIDLGEGFLISPKMTTIPKLAAELESLMNKNDISLEEMIQGVAEEREKYTRS